MTMVDRMESLRREISSKEKELRKLAELEKLLAEVGVSTLPNGAVTALFVTHGRSAPYTYIAYLTDGLFYLTGANSPNKITVDQLVNWLTTSGRRLVGAAVVGVVTTEVVSAFDLGAALAESLGEYAGARPFARWNPFTDNPYGD